VKKHTLILTLLIAVNVYGQSAGHMIPNGYPSLNNFSTSQTDVYATKNYPAALAQLPNNSVALYAERKFMLAEMNVYTFTTGVKTQKGTFGLHGNYFGAAMFRQMNISLGYGLTVSEKIDVGAQFNYHSINQANGYGKTTSINASVGATFHLTDKMHLGLNVYNPTGSKWSKTDGEKLPAQYSLGVGYDVSTDVCFTAEIMKEENLPAGVKAGLHYRFAKQFFARAGVVTASSNWFAGVGFNVVKYRIDLACSYHPQLGITPGLLLLFEVGKKNKPTE